MPMSDDIVSRLRVQSFELKNNKYFSGIIDDWYAESADEIERLRKNVEFWEKRYWQLVAEVTP
jgi:hypothetical protein